MRPDVAAFRELDTLVRNLSEQLAGYRRRALAAESRTRELEHQIAMLDANLTAARESERQHALEAVESAPVGAAAGNEVSPSSEGLQLENERLRARITEARERTSQVADRVRFLRQQLSSGAER